MKKKVKATVPQECVGRVSIIIYLEQVTYAGEWLRNHFTKVFLSHQIEQDRDLSTREF